MGDSVAITWGPWSGAACTGLRNAQALSLKRENGDGCQYETEPQVSGLGPSLSPLPAPCLRELQDG